MGVEGKYAYGIEIRGLAPHPPETNPLHSWGCLTNNTKILNS
jgi:hypothetical protein